MQDTETIVVGYDGSPEAVPAVMWAARHAALRGARLHLVHCSLWPVFTRNMGPVEGVADSGLRHAAESVVAEGLAHAQGESPDLDIKTSLVYGWAAEKLREVSDGAAMLVVGSRGIGGFMGLLVGSVSLELAATARCPVAVIHQGGNPNGPIVVGVDHREWEQALRDAASLAGLTGALLKVVHVHKKPALFPGFAPVAAETPEEARTLLETAAHAAHAMAPGLVVEQRLLEATSVAGALLNEAADSSIIVVGTTGQGIVRETIGSTAHAVLHHATRPVLVSRHAAPVSQ